MEDVLGEALAKLQAQQTARDREPAKLPSGNSSDDDHSTHSGSAAATSVSVAAMAAETAHPLTAETAKPSPQPSEELTATATEFAARSKEPKPGRMTRSVARSIAFVSAHRRQAAAIAILLGMAYLWFDGSSSPDRAAATGSGLAADDSLLKEFDTIEVTPKREPAEPIETSQAEWALTIPQADDTLTSPGSNWSSNAVSGPALTIPTENSGQSPYRAFGFPERGSDAFHGASREAELRRNARFTGQIQSMN